MSKANNKPKILAKICIYCGAEWLSMTNQRKVCVNCKTKTKRKEKNE